MNEEGIRYQEIDYLRGIAILLMVTNHFGYTFLTTIEQEGILFKPLIFLGSFAPVVFFFVTGLGYGVNYHKPIKHGYWLDAIFKAFVLILVERLPLLFNGNFIGMDFLSFIALIIIMVSGARYFKLNTMILIGFVVFLLGMRFIIGPILLENTNYPPVIFWLLGVKSIPEFSYPITPWLVYPFIGYIFGMSIKKYDLAISTLVKLYNKYIILAGLILTLAVLVIAWHKGGFILHRWGTMSFDYFVSSIILLFLVVIISSLFVEKNIIGIVSIEGLASLLVVPVHYFLLKIDYINFNGNTTINILNLLLVIICSYVVSKLLYRAIKKIQTLPYAFLFLCIITLIVLFYSIIVHKGENHIQSSILIFLLQISTAGFFLIKPSVITTKRKIIHEE